MNEKEDSPAGMPTSQGHVCFSMQLLRLMEVGFLILLKFKYHCFLHLQICCYWFYYYNFGRMTAHTD